MNTKTLQVFFNDIDEVMYERRETNNTLAFKWYNENRGRAGKILKRYLCFIMASQTLYGEEGNPFGPCTKSFFWSKNENVLEKVKDRMQVLNS
ncbi:hypothetical protein [Abyssalbus ytuae]|uniref:xylose isomerase n=1 Tax=Abyssalbus ytuae TaxID=2926907 RepID=A0A9E7A0M4_9FLAO|nr:hypothetical protein [Abyssalbus ytuae]UOB18742.1 hypothetical protein MQE35_05480 [Abyssalbus ytuae]